MPLRLTMTGHTSSSEIRDSKHASVTAGFLSKFRVLKLLKLVSDSNNRVQASSLRSQFCREISVTC